MPDEPLTFLGRAVPPEFVRRIVVIEPGRARPYDEHEWRDAIVVLEHGELTLEGCHGGAHRIIRGDVLWLSGMALVALHNTGPDRAVLVAVARRDQYRNIGLPAT